MIKITFPDGSSKEFQAGITALQIAEGISKNLAKDALVAKINDRLSDLSTEIKSDAAVKIITKKDAEALELIRHSTAHVMAQAVMRLYPGTKLDIGPAIDEGFYYDFDLDTHLSTDDFAKIEAEMQKIVKERIPFVRTELSRDEAIKKMESLGQNYKLERIKELPDGETISFYTDGDFVDFCRGPHVPHTGSLGTFKLTKMAGSYFRGDVKNKMLQRVYGTAFTDKEELKKYLDFIEEAKKRDHRVIGKQMDLFSFHPEGPGFPFWHPKGMAILNELYKLWREKQRLAGYHEIKTPLILNEELWHRSGHWDHYRENMYFTTIDEKTYAVKPMNCPGGILIYKNDLHSYRDLPLRLAELGQVHRHELSGVLQGMLRVRTFVQDDAHIYCAPEQLEDEVVGVVRLAMDIYKTCGLKEFHIEVSTRPEHYIGSDEMWEMATNTLFNALKRENIKYEIKAGDGAFYGPKIDMHIKDVLNRSWQCGTVQVDFAMPERFDLEYMAQDGVRKRPVMVHRTLYGSSERFLGILVEHFAGDFPLWMAPVQARLLPITDNQQEYMRSMERELLEADIRFDKDFRSEKIGGKIRQASLDKVPFMIIAGEEEANSGTVAIRHRKNGDIGKVALKDFIKNLREKIDKRTLEY